MSFLDNLELLSDLNQKEKEQLSLFSQEKVLNKWDILFKEWDEWIAMYFLLSWKIEVSKNINWDEVVLWEVKAEEVLWEMALFWKNKIRMASAKALETTELITILSFSIKDLTNKYPNLSEKIKKIIEDRKKCNESIIEKIS